MAVEIETTYPCMLYKDKDVNLWARAENPEEEREAKRHGYEIWYIAFPNLRPGYKS